MRRCTTDENSLAVHNHNGLEGKNKLSVGKLNFYL